MPEEQQDNAPQTAGFLTQIFVSFEARQEARFASLETKLEAKIDERIAELRDELDQRIAVIEERLNDLEDRPNS